MKIKHLYDRLAKLPGFQVSITCNPDSWLPLCDSSADNFMHSCCNCCNLVGFSCSFNVVVFGQRKWRRALSGCIGNPDYSAEVGRSDRCKTSDVGFESAASPTVLYQLTLTGNMSGPHLRGQESERGRWENKEALSETCRQAEVREQVKHKGEDQHKMSF